MLVENKFICVSLPRCEFSYFMTSCMNQDIKIQHLKNINIIL